MYDRLIRNPFTDGRQVGAQGFCRDAFVQMSGETFHRIDLFGIFVELVNDICEEAAAGSEHAVGHVGKGEGFHLHQ